MEYDKDKKEIILNRELSELDKFVLSFIKILKKHIGYVIVSGYVSILLGRSRATEDVDLLIENISEESFLRLWKELSDNGFECMNTSNSKESYDLLKIQAIRFYKNIPVPNIEFKIINTELDKYSFQNKINVVFKKDSLFISSIELQIVYKLFLAADGTDEELIVDKDIEDARHLYKLFKEKINKEELLIFANKLNVTNKLELLE